MDYIPPVQMQPDTPIFPQVIIKEPSGVVSLYKILPANEDLENIANQVKEIFKDGFQFEDIGSIIKLSNDLLDDFISLEVVDKEESLKKVFNYLIDVIDIPYIPDSIIDPILKELIPSFIPLITSIDFKDLFNDDDIFETVDKDSVIKFGDIILSKIDDGFQWSDISTITKYTISICSNLTDLSKEEKINLAKEIIDYALDETDFPKSPDFIVDPIVKAIANSCIEQVIR